MPVLVVPFLRGLAPFSSPKLSSIRWDEGEGEPCLLQYSAQGDSKVQSIIFLPVAKTFYYGYIPKGKVQSRHYLQGFLRTPHSKFGSPSKSKRRTLKEVEVYF
jgi:hypothetical protein